MEEMQKIREITLLKKSNKTIMIKQVQFQIWVYRGCMITSKAKIKPTFFWIFLAC